MNTNAPGRPQAPMHVVSAAPAPPAASQGTRVPLVEEAEGLPVGQLAHLRCLSMSSNPCCTWYLFLISGHHGVDVATSCVTDCWPYG
eukprot:1160741-Pelagomonas_calceolata.AAC.16